MINIKNGNGEIITSVDTPSLRNADLQGADLQGADLRDANLRGANLHDANLHSAGIWFCQYGPYQFILTNTHFHAGCKRIPHGEEVIDLMRRYGGEYPELVEPSIELYVLGCKHLGISK